MGMCIHLEFGWMDGWMDEVFTNLLGWDGMLVYNSAHIGLAAVHELRYPLWHLDVPI
jgi:hypothetical protein